MVAQGGEFSIHHGKQVAPSRHICNHRDNMVLAHCLHRLRSVKRKLRSKPYRTPSSDEGDQDGTATMTRQTILQGAADVLQRRGLPSGWVRDPTCRPTEKKGDTEHDDDGAHGIGYAERGNTGTATLPGLACNLEAARRWL